MRTGARVARWCKRTPNGSGSPKRRPRPAPPARSRCTAPTAGRDARSSAASRRPGSTRFMAPTPRRPTNRRGASDRCGSSPSSPKPRLGTAYAACGCGDWRTSTWRDYAWSLVRTGSATSRCVAGAGATPLWQPCGPLRSATVPGRHLSLSPGAVWDAAEVIDRPQITDDASGRRLMVSRG